MEKVKDWVEEEEIQEGSEGNLSLVQDTEPSQQEKKQRKKKRLRMKELKKGRRKNGEVKEAERLKHLEERAWVSEKLPAPVKEKNRGHQSRCVKEHQGLS